MASATLIACGGGGAAPASTPQAVGKSDPIVILVTGQSNASFEYPFTWDAPPNMRKWNWDGKLDHIGAAFAAPDGKTVGFGLALAGAVAKANPTTPTYLINVAYGGAQISAWAPGAAEDVYAAMSQNVEVALRSIGESKIDGFVWWQGETDAEFAIPGYAEAFEKLNARMAAESWWDPSAPTVIMGTSTLSTPKIAAFNETLTALAATKPSKRTYVNTSKLSAEYWDPNPDLGAYLHMRAAGYDAAGKLAAEAYLSATAGH